MSQNYPTTTENKPRGPAGVAWQGLARTQLTLPAEADVDQLRSALLSEVHNDDGWLSPLRQDCYEFLLRPANAAASASIPRGLRTVHERELLTEIDAFADQFFNLPPPQRAQRWHELLSQCEQAPRAEHRLRQLEHGIGLTLPALNRPHEADAKNLLDVLCNIFVMRPQARANARANLRAKYRTEPVRWAAAAKILYAALPNAVGLDRRLFNDLRTGQVGDPVAEPVIQQYVSVAPRPTPRTTSSPGSTWWIYPVVLGVMAMLRGFSSNSDRSNYDNSYNRRYPYPDYNTYQPPSKNYNEVYENALKRLREEQQRASQPYEFPNLPPEVNKSFKNDDPTRDRLFDRDEQSGNSRVPVQFQLSPELQRILQDAEDRNKFGSGSLPGSSGNDSHNSPASNPYSPNRSPSGAPDLRIP